MTKVRWALSGFNGEGSSEKCLVMTGNERGGEGSPGKEKGASWVWFFFNLFGPHLLEITWQIVWITIFLPHIWICMDLKIPYSPDG